MALRLAERQAELRHAGWRVVRVEPQVVETLRDKAAMLRPLGDPRGTWRDPRRGVACPTSPK